MKSFSKISLILFAIVMAASCVERQASHSGHDKMLAILKTYRASVSVPDNPFSPGDGLRSVDSMLVAGIVNPAQEQEIRFVKASLSLKQGDETSAISIFTDLDKNNRYSESNALGKNLGITFLRKGERANCISNHAAESCILPIKGLGVHHDPTGSQNAINVYKNLLAKDPHDLESRWLLNLAYMTLGQYPSEVPKQFLIPGMAGDTVVRVKPFRDIAGDLKLDVKNQAGGSVVEDFDNDGYLDILTSGMGIYDEIHYFKNNTDGTFSDQSEKTGLRGITGGLNMIQADYDNDGFMDVFVLRGGWKRQYGKEPNSLLRNNGDGTFTDVTIEAGLLSFHPTQTGTWNDFNNDGWIDLFIGNETWAPDAEPQPCELYINNQDGTFREISATAQVNIVAYVKGVSSGDYDNDGWQDLFVSTLSGKRMLLKNMGKSGEEIKFLDISEPAGLNHETSNTFPAWFWDYNNDGWLDIFACDYTLVEPVAACAAAEKLNIPCGSKDKTMLFRNNKNGTLTNVATEVGLNKTVYAMGSNFGDIDNDGFLDMYLGSGTPDFKALIPNKMFKNLGGEQFADVTNSARVGHLQKGHGVSFADIDNDGDQDIYIDMGGVYPADIYQNSFFLNPGQSTNNWITLRLEGKKSNRAAIGTRIELKFTDGAKARTVYRDVNSGGSFGCSPMRKEIGLGQAVLIDEIKIQWHGSGLVQTFKNVKPNQFLKIVEGDNEPTPVSFKAITWIIPDPICPPGQVN